MEGDLNPLDRKDLGVEGTSSGNIVRLFLEWAIYAYMHTFLV